MLRTLGAEGKKPYSTALINCSAPRRGVAACPLAFGETDIKARVKSVLRYKKPAAWAVLAAAVALCAVAVCFLTDPQQAVPSVFSPQSSATLDGVALRITAAELSSSTPCITLEWINDTDKKLRCGEQLTVLYSQNGIWQGDDTAAAEPRMPLEANAAVTHTYRLHGQSMTRLGRYRLEVPFAVDGASEALHTAQLEFELCESIENAAVHTLKPCALVYDDALFSYLPTVEDLPTYIVTDRLQLLQKADGTVTPLGALTAAAADSDSFDTRFRFGQQTAADTLRSLKDGNKRMWQLYGASQRLYILLEQQDGSFYLGVGSYDCGSPAPANADNSYIRWLYRCEELAAP